MTEALAGTEALVAALLARTLPKSAWTHLAHLRVGLWHVRRLGEAGALTALRSAISSYNEAVGTANTDTSGYHETLTIFYVRLIADYLQRAEPSTDIPDEAIEAELIAACGARELPLEYYSREKLFSIEARRGWVAPDLKPLPARGESCDSRASDVSIIR